MGAGVGLLDREQRPLESERSAHQQKFAADFEDFILLRRCGLVVGRQGQPFGRGLKALA